MVAINPVLGTFAAHAQPSKTQGASDSQIESEVTARLSSTDWFPNLRVQVKNGLVFLDGEIPSQEKKDWAEKLILKTPGVIDIVDRSETTLQPHEILSPAAEETRKLLQRFHRLVPYLVSSVLILIVFGLLSYFAHKILLSVIQKRLKSILMAQALAKVFALFFLMIGLYLALKSSGLSGLAYTVLGGTGFIGLGVGLALKNSLENYAAGILISVRETFRKGEIIQINGIEGVVQAVTSRGTSLMDYEGNHIIIPNSEVFKSTIKNLTRNPNMRADFGVGIGYDDSVDKARKVIRETLAKMDTLILKDPDPLVTVDNLGAATVNLRIYFWFDAIKYSKLKIQSLVIQKVKEALMDAQISMPDDAREVVFTSPLHVVQSAEKDVPAKAPDKINKSETPSMVDFHGEDLSSEWNQVKKQALMSEASEKGEDLLGQ